MAFAFSNSTPVKGTLEEELNSVFQPIIKPEMKESWNRNWKKWFVTTNEVEDKRFPGKVSLYFKNFNQFYLVET